MSAMLSPGDRKSVAVIASLGLAETGFINANKFGLLGGGSGAGGGLCNSVSCSEILSGPWSQAFGVPLTVPGMAAYGAVLFLALAPLALGGQGLGPDDDEEGGEADEDTSAVELWTQKGLMAVTSAMAVFSVYLMSILALKIRDVCPWCLVSATLSLTLAVKCWGRKVSLSDLKLGLSSATITALVAGTLFVTTSTDIALAEAQAPPPPFFPPTLPFESDAWCVSREIDSTI